MIAAPHNLFKLAHRLIDNARYSKIEFVDRLSALEINVRVLGRAAYHGPVWSQCSHLVRGDKLIVYHLAYIIKRKLFDLLYLMAGPESVKEMQKRHP